MKYLLVAQSLKKYSELEEYCMPLGIAYINGAMRAEGYNVDAINMLFEDEPMKALVEKIQEQDTDVLMCGGLTSEYRLLKQIYKTARETKPGIIIVGGGGGFTSEPILFSELTGVDYAVIGEGEITNCELANALENNLDVSRIQGLVYKTEDGYSQTHPRPYIKNVDSIPFPSYEGLSMDKYLDNQNVDGWYNYYTYYSDTPRMMPMLMARSCPFQCSFCFHPIGKGYRTRSLDNFFEELDMWVEKYRINGIALIDECFSIEPKRVIEFCGRIKPYKIAWACQMRAETYTDEVLSAMKEAGCIGACFGIESMSEKVLTNMNKHLNEKILDRALTLTYKYRLGCTGNFIFGSEAEDFETVSESLMWHYNHAEKYKNHPVRQFSYVQTYPGSIYYENACKKGLISNRKNFIEQGNWNLNITGLTGREYETIGDIVRLCRRENYNKGEVIQIKHISKNRVNFTFRCSFCGEINTYHRMNASRFTEGKIKRLGCRKCNMLGDYILDEERYKYDKYISIPWLLGLLAIDIPVDYVYKKGWHRIGVCGMNAFSRKMIQELKKITDVEIVFIYDYEKNDESDYGVPEFQTGDALPEADVIINADLAYWKDMEKHVRKIFVGPIVYMETLLRELYEKKRDFPYDFIK